MSRYTSPVNSASPADGDDFAPVHRRNFICLACSRELTSVEISADSQLFGFVGFGGGRPGGFRAVGRALRGGGRLFHKFEGAGAAQDSGAFVARAGAFGVFELGFDVVAVVVALHGEDYVRVVLGDFAFGGGLGAAVVGNLAVDHQVAGTAFFAVLPVKVAVLDCAGKQKFVSRSLAMRFAGEVRDPVAVVAAARNRSSGQEQQGANHCKADRISHSHRTSPWKR